MRYAIVDVAAGDDAEDLFMTGKPGWTEGWDADITNARLYHRKADATRAVRRLRVQHSTFETPCSSDFRLALVGVSVVGFEKVSGNAP